MSRGKRLDSSYLHVLTFLHRSYMHEIVTLVRWYNCREREFTIVDRQTALHSATTFLQIPLTTKGRWETKSYQLNWVWLLLPVVASTLRSDQRLANGGNWRDPVLLRILLGERMSRSDSTGSSKRNRDSRRSQWVEVDRPRAIDRGLRVELKAARDTSKKQVDRLRYNINSNVRSDEKLEKIKKGPSLRKSAPK